MDEVAEKNRRWWTEAAKSGCDYTLPWLDLRPDVLRFYARGATETLPPPYICIYPREVLQDVAGKDVLCLASGGGQQSAVYGLLGARVTVLDLTEEQLAGDRRAAMHHGYEVVTIQGDMRKLNSFSHNAFDLIYQAISICFVPDIREVYRGVARVLRPGGLYRVGHCNPATQLVEESSWDGEAYRLSSPYCGGDVGDPDTAEFRHLLSDIFTGLTDVGLRIRGVWEDPRHLNRGSRGKPGSYEHMLTVVQQYFAVLARKPVA
jgi:ubiquinone/menaquinone biosynthesis C-methylase UbiE